jgi:hypothetical protein
MRFPHGLFRDAFGQASDLIGASANGDRERAAKVGSFYENVLAFLRVHHGAEDELLWPLLRERAPQHTALLDRMEDQHAAVEEVTGSADRAVAAYASAPTQEHAAALVTAVRRLAIELDSHLVDEEREILPLAATTLSQDEWGAMPGWAMGHFQGDKPWLILGLIFEQMTSEERAITLEHMPPPVGEMWSERGEHDFMAFRSEVRG